MIGLFEKIIEMSLYGSIVILFVVLIRFILRKSSKRLMMILWAAVALRLLVPVNIESPMSLFNHIPYGAASIKEQLFVSGESCAEPDNSGVFPVKTGENAVLSYSEAIIQNHTEDTAASVNAYREPADNTINKELILFYLWAAGAAAVAVYCVVRYIMLRKSLTGSVETEHNVFVSDKVDSPFVFGFLRPAIYLPDTLCEAEREYILLHERTHIRRGDWLSKMAGMAAVALHWFNPCVWLAYMLFERDLEMSCDEKTIENMDEDLKKAYSLSIVSFASKKHSKRYIITPLAFSKINFSKSEVTNRVKNILNYKKGSKAVLVLTAVLLLVFSTACSLNAKTENKEAANTEANANTNAADAAEADKDSVNTNADDKTVAAGSNKVILNDSSVYVLDKNSNMAVDTEAFVTNIPDTLTAAGYENTEITKKDLEGFVQYSFNSIKREDELHKNCLQGCAEVYESADLAKDVFISRVKGYTGAVPEETNGISVSYYQKLDSYGTCNYTTICRKDNCVIVFSSAMVVGPTGSSESVNSDISVDLVNYEKILNDNGIAYSIVDLS